MIKINLLPKELTVQRETNVWSVVAVVVPFLALGVAVTMHVMRINELNQVTEEVTVMSAELEARKADIAEQNNLDQKKRELSVFSNVRTTLQALSSDWRGDIERFVRQIPTGSTNPTISLNTLGVSMPAAATAPDGRPTSKLLTIQGVAKTNQALIDFVKAFEESQDFALQFQNASRKQESNQYNFTVNVNLIKANNTENSGESSTNSQGSNP